MAHGITTSKSTKCKVRISMVSSPMYWPMALLFNGLYFESVSVDGTMVTVYPNSDAEAILLRISPDTGLIWSRSIGFSNPSAYPIDMYSDGDTVAFHIEVPSNGDISYDSGLSRPNENSGNDENYVFWVDVSNGEIVDIESTYAIGVYGRSNDGGVIAAGYQMMYYYMPDSTATMSEPVIIVQKITTRTSRLQWGWDRGRL